jgi:hypothetical protein
VNWTSAFEQVGIFAIASGQLVWLIKALVGQSLARDIETFKAELQKVHADQLEEAKNHFTVGATSHMANVAFDKHVQFCEEYVEEVFRVMEKLFRQGPHEDALQYAYDLTNVRKRRAVWLTPEIESILERFEGAFRKIGASAGLVKAMPGDPKGIKVMFEEFAKVFGPEYGFKEWNGEAVAEDYTMVSIIASLRKVLGIAELTRLRSEFIKRASENLANAY